MTATGGIEGIGSGIAGGSGPVGGGGGGGGAAIQPETGSSPIKISAFPAATRMNTGDTVTGLQGGANVNFTQADLFSTLDAASGYSGPSIIGYLGKGGAGASGGTFGIYGGNAPDNGAGGAIFLAAGFCQGSGNGGNASLSGGGSTTGTGGPVSVVAGQSDGGPSGGQASLRGGSGVGGNSAGGNAVVVGGTGYGSGSGGGTVVQGGPGGITGNGGSTIIYGGQGGAGSGAGGNIALFAGSAQVNSSGGYVLISGGTAVDTGAGGYLSLKSGNGQGGSHSGVVTLKTGNTFGSASGFVGDLRIYGGYGNTAGVVGGNVIVKSGPGYGNGTAGGALTMQAGVSFNEGTGGNGGITKIYGGAGYGSGHHGGHLYLGGGPGESSAANGSLFFKNLPTSPAGLTAGALFNNANTLCLAPGPSAASVAYGPFGVYDLGKAAGGTPTSVLSGLTIPAGSAIVIFTIEDTNTGTSGTLADTPGNTYVAALTKNPNGATANGVVAMWVTFNSVALSAGSITYTSHTSGNAAAISGFWVSGCRQDVTPVDTHVTNFNTGSTTTPNVTSNFGGQGAPQAQPTLFVGGVCVTGAPAWTQASGWNTPFDLENSSGSIQSLGGWQVNYSASAGITFNPTIGTSLPWVAMIIGLMPGT